VRQGSKKVIFTDQFIPKNWNGSNATTIRTAYQTFHKEGYNAVYADGHAAFIPAAFVEGYIQRMNYTTNDFYYWFLVAAANENP
jgi:prepilin-type processing-associated H-X9-DG protein